MDSFNRAASTAKACNDTPARGEGVFGNAFI